MILSAGAVVVLVVSRKGVALVVGTLAALAWGSSQLPLQSLAYPAKFAMFGVVAATMVYALVSNARDRLPIPVGFATGLFALLLFGLASFAWSISPSFTVQRTLSTMLLGAAVCFGIPSALRDSNDVKGVYYWSGLLLGLVAVSGVILGAAGAVVAYSGSRYQGVLIDPNTLGYFAAPLVPPMVLLAASMPGGRRRRLLIAAIICTVGAIAVTGSRGGALSVSAGILVGLSASQLARQSRQARRAILIAIGLVVAAVLVFPLLGASARVGGNGNEGFFELGTGSLRTVSWRQAVPTILKEPLTGHGFGTTPIIYPQLQSKLNAYVLGGAHDGYIDTALELGFIGTAALIVLAGSGVVAAFRLARSPGAGRILGPILLAAIVGGIVESLVESGILNAGGLFAFPFWMAVALAHSLRIADIRERSAKATRAATAAVDS
jgi:O-antigen ligase